MTAAADPSSLSTQHTSLLLSVTGRGSLPDALHWIAEGRPISGGPTAAVLAALVCSADLGLTKAESALRAAAKLTLKSTLDTSADLLSTESVVRPDSYQQALNDVADRTVSGSLAGISATAVASAQAHNPLVVETLGLVAGLSWRDLRDRSEARGAPLPIRSSGPWKSSQIVSVFTIVDDVVTGRLEPQLPEAVSARPVELLLNNTVGWPAVEAIRANGVSFGTLLAQRDVGSAWSAHRNRTNAELSRLMVVRLLTALDTAAVRYWSTEGDSSVPSSFLAAQAVRPEHKAPGQLSAVTRTAAGDPDYAVLVSVARDGGTARKTASTFLRLPQILKLPGVLMLVGPGWAARSESDRLVRAFEGRVFTEATLPALAALAAAGAPPSADRMTTLDGHNDEEQP